MEHNERLKIAEYFTNKMMRKYGKEILAGGIFGSTSRNEDTKFSDLEMIFIVKDKSNAKPVEFLYKDIIVSIDIEKIGDVKKNINDVTILWPLQMKRLIDFQVTCGNNKILKDFHKTMKKIPDHKFKKAVEKELITIYDIQNKIKSNRLLKVDKEIVAVSKEILYSINLSLALLNRRYFTRNYYKNFTEAYDFKKLPKNYQHLCDSLWVCRDVKRIIELSDELIKNYFELLEKYGIRLKECTSLDKIKLSGN